MTIDTSKIDRMDVRLRVLDLDAARVALAKAADEEERDEDPEYNAAYEAIIAQKDAAFTAARKIAEQTIADLNNHKGVSAQTAIEQHDAALEYSEVAVFDDDGQAERCCLTGLPILHDEETVEDSQGRKALALALAGWPVFDDEDDGGEDTGDEEAA